MYAQGNAFPYVLDTTKQPHPSVYMGLTVYQHVAIQCMAGLLANPHFGPFTMPELAKLAKEAADALCSAVN